MKIKGELLKKHRQNKGYSLRELANKSGISLSTLNKWETSNSSNPLPSKLVILTNALDITMDDLLCADKEEENKEVKVVQNNIVDLKLNTPKNYLVNLRKKLYTNDEDGLSGLEGLLNFKDKQSNLSDDTQAKTDEAIKVKSYIKEIYHCEEDDISIIFDTLTFYEMFKDAKTNYGNITFDKAGSNIVEYNGINELFKDHSDILELLNELSELQYSLANLMPFVNVGQDNTEMMNLSNTTPDLFYNHIKNTNTTLYDWINKNKERYALEVFTKFKGPHIMLDGKPKLILDLNNQESVTNFKESLVEVIATIYKRATQLCLLKNRHQYSIIKKISTKYLYIDNRHQAPNSADMIARDYKSVIQLLRFFHFDIIDIDCGFSDDDKNALDVLRFMVDKNISVSEIKVHSDYVIGKSEIIQYIKDNKDKLIGD